MIKPFTPTGVNFVTMDSNGQWVPSIKGSVTNTLTPRRNVLSYGLTSFGYDLRLSENDFRIFQRVPGEVVDPKNFNPSTLKLAELHYSAEGDYFILPANSYGLGVAVEKLKLPNDVLAICVGKSTYARCGIIANVTPAEPGWEGHLTLEFSNSSAADCRMYVNEGAVQMVFYKGSPCRVSYADRGGKYQDQTENVVIPIV